MQASNNILVEGRFTKTQLELLKFFATNPTEQELEDIRRFFIQYLAEKALKSVDKAVKSKGYDMEEINAWSKEHNRISYKSIK